MYHRLDTIREFEKNNLQEADAPELPLFHVTGGAGWINDPNGFSIYQGEYHLFFQYHPYKKCWGLMHWGHVKSKDLIHWERLPAALAPDREYDRDGCFSGSAIALEDGRHLLMYTGVCRKIGMDGREADVQTQCIAIGDGINYEKYEGNPVIDQGQLPENGDPENFRDPAIWKDEKGYHAVIGNRGTDGSGASVLLYDSEDALRWTYRGILAGSCDQYGEMWECPDYFHLCGEDVLLASFQNIPAAIGEFRPGNAAACLIGTNDPVPVDYGADFYAPQTLETPDGRRIMIAWMQHWETSSYAPEELPFFGQMTVPRELTICGGRLIQRPVRELDSYRGGRIQYKNVMLTSETSLPGIAGRCLDMTVRIRPVKDVDRYQWFCVKAALSDRYVTSIRYNPESSTVCVDRTHSNPPCDISNVWKFPVRNREGALDLRIVMDRYSLEIFVNDGEQAASFVIYTPQNASSIRFACEGRLLMDVDQYELMGSHH